MLPRLQVLSIGDVAVWWGCSLRPLLTEELGQLRELTIASSRFVLLGFPGDVHWDNEPFTFRFRVDDEEGQDEEENKRGSNLQLALCRATLSHLRLTLERYGEEAVEVPEVLADCENIERELLKKQRARMTTGSRTSSKRARVEHPVV